MKILGKSEWGGKIFYSNGTSNSRGVAILIPDSLAIDIKIISECKDQTGRMLVIDCKIEGLPLTLVNIYAPTRDRLAQQITFLAEMRDILQNLASKDLIIGGDFNTNLNNEIGKKGGTHEIYSSYTKNLKSFIEEYKLTDIWRLRHPNELKFTRREQTRCGLVQSRLDFWLISESISYIINKCGIKPRNQSDHSLINIKIEILNTMKRDQGYWKFNNKLLHDKAYGELIKSEIEIIKAEENKIENKNTFWDYVKCRIRTVTITCVINKAKAVRENKLKVKAQLDNLEKELIISPGTSEEYFKIKAEWERLEKCEADGIFRSNVKWIEEGERNTKYFINLKK